MSSVGNEVQTNVNKTLLIYLMTKGHLPQGQNLRNTVLAMKSVEICQHVYQAKNYTESQFDVQVQYANERFPGIHMDGLFLFQNAMD